MVFRSYQAENRFIFALQLGQFIWTECCVCNSLISHKTRPNSSFATNLQQASGEDFWNLMDESEISSCKPRTGGLSAWIGYTDLDQDTHFQWSDNTQDTDCVNLSNFCKEFFRHQDSLRIQLLRDCGRIHSCIADEMILLWKTFMLRVTSVATSERVAVGHFGSRKNGHPSPIFGDWIGRKHGGIRLGPFRFLADLVPCHLGLCYL